MRHQATRDDSFCVQEPPVIAAPDFMPQYDDISNEDLVRLLQARDRREATWFGLVWETNEVERDRALNSRLRGRNHAGRACAAMVPAFLLWLAQ